MRRFFAIARDWLLFLLGPRGDFQRLTFDPTKVTKLAVVLQRTNPCATHAGVAYRDTGGTLRLLHFATHLRLFDEHCNGQFAYSRPSMKIEDLDYLAGFCARVYRANRAGKLPYSFEFDVDLLFDSNSGLITSDHGRGFTCSTFVVALFRSAGHNLVESITWPNRASEADVASRRQVITAWRDSGRPEFIARANEIEPTIHTMRISPQQVSGACLYKATPVGFRCATATGRRIHSEVSRQIPSPA
jgi:hypothetical protein